MSVCPKYVYTWALDFVMLCYVVLRCACVALQSIHSYGTDQLSYKGSLPQKYMYTEYSTTSRKSPEIILTLAVASSFSCSCCRLSTSSAFLPTSPRLCSVASRSWVIHVVAWKSNGSNTSIRLLSVQILSFLPTKRTHILLFLPFFFCAWSSF